MKKDLKLNWVIAYQHNWEKKQSRLGEEEDEGKKWSEQCSRFIFGKRAARLARLGCTVAFPLGLLWRTEGASYYAFPEYPVPSLSAQCRNHRGKGEYGHWAPGGKCSLAADWAPLSGRCKTRTRCKVHCIARPGSPSLIALTSASWKKPCRGYAPWVLRPLYGY